jgi:two-component system CheB/CheR fusion protein
MPAKSKSNSSNGGGTNSEISEAQASRTAKDFLVVGIGASAGGISALNEFFSAMPPDSGMAFVVVLHLSPDYESTLDAILQTHTAMPVVQVKETTKVEPDHVYVIPPNRNLVMVDGTVRLTRRVQAEGSRVSIDLFFRTLSESYGRKAVCIILSGTGTDGTLGLKAVKGRTGFAMVQAPEDAEYDGMPKSAIATKLVDVVLPADKMPEKLLWVRDSTERFKLDTDDDKQLPDVSGVDALREILTVIRVRTGHDFSNYKHPTLLRRIARHLQIHELDDMKAYLEILREKPEEVQSLVHNLLINVTNFFRDRAAFDSIEKTVIPDLFEGKKATDQIRVWTAGCATGEEAYSMAMLLCEYANSLADPPKIQIFASDVDDDAISSAREGRYVEAIETDISPERLKRFFVKEGVHYRVKKVIREMVLFAPHNILRDPPFSRIDMVSCRNVMIYLNRETQDRVMNIFHFALRPGGYLFLGSSESADSQSELYLPIDKKNRIYRRQGPLASARHAPLLDTGAWNVRAHEIEQINRESGRSYGELHDQLIAPYAPPSILVNGEFDVVHMSSSAGRYLRFAGGEPTKNICKLANPDLVADLRVALFAAQRDEKTSEFQDIRTEIDGTSVSINLIVRPVETPEFGGRFLLVVFDEKGSTLPQFAGGDHPIPSVAGDDAMQGVIGRLEEELRQTKSRLGSTIEQHETSVEELKASNEELQAINEELRSATEELETSKEELQSVNEELITVNHELKEKVDEVTRAHSDLQNLMESTDIATIFLDRELNVKNFTPQVAEIYNIIPSDIGRPLTHLTHRLKVADFTSDAAQVLRTLHRVERETRSSDERAYIVRFSPYRSTDDRIDGIVMSFIDITERRNAEDALQQHTADLARHVNEMEGDGELERLRKEVNDLSDRVGDKPPYDLGEKKKG